MAIKALQQTGVSALCSHLKETKSTADQAGSAVTSLAESVADSLEEIDLALDDRQEKTASTTITIPTTGWQLDDDEEDSGVMDYPYYYDITDASITANDMVTINISPSSVTAATSCGLCPANESMAGAIRIRTVTIPTEAIAAEYRVETGKEN